MKHTLFFFFLFSTLTLATTTKFNGKWAAISKACIPDSILEITNDKLLYQNEKPKTFKVVKQDETTDWLELTSKLECAASCEYKFYRIRKSDKGQIEVASGDKVDGDNWSQCWYYKKSAK